MKRTPMIFIVFLMLGGIVNVAVAWSFWLFAGERPLRQYVKNEPPHAAVVHAVDSLFDEQPRLVRDGQAHPSRAFGIDQFIYGGEYQDIRKTVDINLAVIWTRYGVPSRSIQGGVIHYYDPDAQMSAFEEVFVRSIDIENMAVFDHLQTEIYLPYGIRWAGFVANSMVYAALLLLAFRAILASLHHHRTKRGLCAYCTYPVGTSLICSECGAEIKGHKKAR